MAIVAVACSSDDDGGGDANTGAAIGSPTAVASTLTVENLAERRYAVGVRTVEFVDTSRPLAPNGDFPGAPERTLMTEVWYPAALRAAGPETRDAPPRGEDAPYPLIIFAHGFTSTPRQSASYTQHLASRGYVVASIAFPGSTLGAPGGPRLTAVLDQPADVSFVLDRLLGGGDPQIALLAGMIDSEKVGMTGHSLGGLTTLITAYGDRRDPRIDAIVPFSAPACLAPADLPGDAVVPAMVVGGSNDLIVNPASIRQGYDLSSAPKYFVEVIGGDHLRFADIDLMDEAVAGRLGELSGGNFLEDALEVGRLLKSDVSTCLGDDPDPQSNPSRATASASSSAATRPPSSTRTFAMTPARSHSCNQPPTRRLMTSGSNRPWNRTM